MYHQKRIANKERDYTSTQQMLSFNGWVHMRVSMGDNRNMPLQMEDGNPDSRIAKKTIGSYACI